MKWENLDINVAKPANIPKFSNLDKLFLDDVLVDMIVGYTTLYSYREKADISFEITDEKILFLSMILLSGCHKLLDCKMY